MFLRKKKFFLIFKKILKKKKRLESQHMRLSVLGGSHGCIWEEDVAGGGISLRVGGWGVHSHVHMHTWLFPCASRLIYLGGCAGTGVQMCAHRVKVAALGWAGSLGLAGHQPPEGSR